MEREKNCDIHVIAFEYSPALYAETLLQAERIKQMVPGFQLAAVNRKKQLLNRIRFFSEKRSFAQPMRFNIIAPLVGLCLLLLLSSAILFNTGHQATPVNISKGLPYLPLTDGMISATDADLPLKITPSQKELETLVKIVQEQQPIIEKKLKELEPVIKEMSKNAAVLARQVQENYLIPVAEKENDADQQIIIKEESSGSNNASVKVYFVTFENGEWILTPQWALSAKEAASDSSQRTIDTSAPRVKRRMQQ